MKFLPKNRMGQARLGVLVLILVGLAYQYHAIALVYYLTYFPQEGDIVFQSLPHGELVDAIEGITKSPYSHCGVISKNKDGQWVVIEAIGYVHDTPLYLWVLRGRSGGFSAYRLKTSYRPLIPKFIEAVKTYEGKPYDYDYDMSDDAIYCSELAFKGFRTASNAGI